MVYIISIGKIICKNKYSHLMPYCLPIFTVILLSHRFRSHKLLHFVVPFKYPVITRAGLGCPHQPRTLIYTRSHERTRERTHTHMARRRTCSCNRKHIYIEKNAHTDDHAYANIHTLSLSHTYTHRYTLTYSLSLLKRCSGNTPSNPFLMPLGHGGRAGKAPVRIRNSGSRIRCCGFESTKGSKKEMLPLIATLPGVEIHEKPRALKKKRLQ